MLQPNSAPLVVSRSSLAAAFVLFSVLYACAFLFLCGGNGVSTGGVTGVPDIDHALHIQAPAAMTAKELALACPAPAPCPPSAAAVCPECKACPPPEPCPAVPAPASVAALAAPVAASGPKKTSATAEVEVLWPSSGTTTDTVGQLVTLAPRGAQSRRGDQYRLCSFTNVCAHNDKLYFRHSDAATAQGLLKEWMDKCWKVEQWKQPAICACFHPNFLPAFLEPQDLPADQPGTRVHGNTWSVHKWVSQHHIAHWAQKLVIWSSVYEHFAGFPSATGVTHPIDRMLFHDSDPPMSDHETVIFDAVLDALQPPNYHGMAKASGPERVARVLWADPLRAQKSAWEASKPSPAAPGQHFTCFDRLTLCPHYGMFATHPEDTAPFRDAVYRRFNLPVAQRCPPRRAVLMYRHNRGIINKDELRAVIKAQFDLDLEYGTVDESSTSEQQVRMFASTGLMLSSHSSQMINVLFSPAGGAMVEIAPEFYNADFAEYAHGMGVFFQYALGGTVPGGEPQPLQTACVQHLAQCEGASFCVLQHRWKCKNEDYPNKNRDFIANVTAVTLAVKNSLAHLNWLCGGRW